MSTSSLRGLSHAADTSNAGPKLRMDPQTLAESNGLTDERFRGIANMGPAFDMAFGARPNPGDRPDSEAFAPTYEGPATRQEHLFKGGGVDENMAMSPQWWASIDGPYAPTIDSLPPSLRGLMRTT